MALDFTVVISVRQRFGDDEVDDLGQETETLFVGRQKRYPFRCPSVDARQHAILLFQCQGGNVQQTLEINDQQIFGGIPAAIGSLAGLSFDHVVNVPVAQWNGNIMLIHPGVLREDNVLLIRAKGLGDDNIDNFIIDNLVVVFKTKQGGG